MPSTGVGARSTSYQNIMPLEPFWFALKLEGRVRSVHKVDWCVHASTGGCFVVLHASIWGKISRCFFLRLCILWFQDSSTAQNKALLTKIIDESGKAFFLWDSGDLGHVRILSFPVVDQILLQIWSLKRKFSSKGRKPAFWSGWTRWGWTTPVVCLFLQIKLVLGPDFA